MRYDTIIYRDGDAGGIVMHIGERFSSVMNYARQLVQSGSASRVETFDADGNLRFHFPRVLHAG